MALVLEAGAMPEDDFAVKLFRLITAEVPCDWQVVSLKARCPYGECATPHLLRVSPDGNEPDERCNYGTTLGFFAMLWRVQGMHRVTAALEKTVWQEDRPRCLEADAALASISDSVAYYAVPYMQHPGLLSEASAHWRLRNEAHAAMRAGLRTTTTATTSTSTRSTTTSTTRTATSSSSSTSTGTTTTSLYATEGGLSNSSERGLPLPARGAAASGAAPAAKSAPAAASVAAREDEDAPPPLPHLAAGAASNAPGDLPAAGASGDAISGTSERLAANGTAAREGGEPPASGDEPPAPANAEAPGDGVSTTEGGLEGSQAAAVAASGAGAPELAGASFSGGRAPDLAVAQQAPDAHRLASGLAEAHGAVHHAASQAGASAQRAATSVSSWLGSVLGIAGQAPGSSGADGAAEAVEDRPLAVGRRADKGGVWRLVAEASFCPSARKRLSPARQRRSVQECQDLASADSECGDTMYSNGADDCYCVPEGGLCSLRASSRGNNVYQQAPR